MIPHWKPCFLYLKYVDDNRYYFYNGYENKNIKVKKYGNYDDGDDSVTFCVQKLWNNILTILTVIAVLVVFEGFQTLSPSPSPDISGPHSPTNFVHPSKCCYSPGDTLKSGSRLLGYPRSLLSLLKSSVLELYFLFLTKRLWQTDTQRFLNNESHLTE